MKAVHAKSVRGGVVGALVLLGALSCVGATTASQREATARDPVVPTYCVQVWPEARYRNYGYDHIVHLYNGCSTSATCLIATNVAPKAIKVRVASKQQLEVVTYRGSPSQEFQVQASCELDK
jgi:hypothetical protein